MILLELFSGIGGFAKGIMDAGIKIEKHYFSEIDKHAIANYKYNFKQAEYVGSVVDVSGIEADIITFGSPCQDFSLAGNRAGMEGERSVLILEAIRIISESRPSVFIWENVKGAFSSNDGADFWAIISAFANIGGYRLEWQLLNTSWFLPQNRERIYLVGHLAGRSEPGIFPIGEEIEMANKSRSATEKQIASCIQGSGGHIANGEYKGMNLIKITSGTKSGYEIAKMGDGIRFNHLVEGETLRQTGRGRVSKGTSHTLDCSATQGVLLDEGIRKFTEIEEERLQGFPDDWTKYGNYDGEIKEISKTQRYKMCGNAVTTNVVKAIAQKLNVIQ